MAFWLPCLSFDPYPALASARSFSPTLLCLDFHFPEIADCLGPFSASEMASDVHPTASPAELQSHRRILALGLTERVMATPLICPELPRDWLMLQSEWPNLSTKGLTTDKFANIDMHVGAFGCLLTGPLPPRAVYSQLYAKTDENHQRGSSD